MSTERNKKDQFLDTVKKLRVNCDGIITCKAKDNKGGWDKATLDLDRHIGVRDVLKIPGKDISDHIDELELKVDSNEVFLVGTVKFHLNITKYLKNKNGTLYWEIPIEKDEKKDSPE